MELWQLQIVECGLWNSNGALNLCCSFFNPKLGTRPKGGSPQDKSEIRNLKSPWLIYFPGYTTHADKG